MSTRSIAVVTGAGSGTGRETAVLLDAEGVEVIGVDVEWRRPDEFITRVTGGVHDPEVWRRVADLIDARDGTVDRVALCAGKLAIGTATTVPDAELRFVFEVNVFGAFEALRTLLPRMRRGGSIVAVTSIDASHAEQNLAAYSASKGALLQLMRSVSLDFGHLGIRATAVSPGVIDTPFFQEHVDAATDPAIFLAAKTARYPIGRILDAVEVARVIAFVLSPLGSGISGTELMVDGALNAGFDYRPPAAEMGRETE